MDKHTPGPWQVNFNNAGTAKQIRDSNKGFPIGEVYFGDSSMIGENKANALLIAAAPEMYDLLKYFCMNEYCGDHAEEVKQLLSKITPNG